jgi:putative tricarboxylic transport membrane protein
MRKALHAIVAASALAAVPALAQTYPARSIEVTVHTSAGSGGDVVSRAVAEIIRREKLLPQPLQVVNRVGGSGALAFNYFKTRRGDPYSLLSVTGTILAMAYRPDMNIGLENYTPVALMVIDPQTVMVPANSPYKTFKDLIEAARKSPDTLVAATTSVVGTGRMVVHLMEKAVPGAKFRFVTFKGGGDAMTATAGGHTTFTTENLSEGAGFVEAKTLRVLAIASEKRLPQAPDVPTLKELGYPIAAGTIRGFTFPAGVPKEAVTVMENALAQVHKSAAWQELVKRNIYEDTFMGSAEFTKFLKVRMEEYRGFYDAIGLDKMK